MSKRKKPTSQDTDLGGDDEWMFGDEHFCSVCGRPESMVDFRSEERRVGKECS